MPTTYDVEAMRVESDRRNAIEHLKLAIKHLESAGLHMAAALIKKQCAQIKYQAGISQMLQDHAKGVL